MKPKIELSDFTGLLGKFINILRLGELNIFPEEKEPEVPPPIEDNLDDNKTHNEEQHLNNTDIITPVVVKETKLVTQTPEIDGGSQLATGTGIGVGAFLLIFCCFGGIIYYFRRTEKVQEDIRRFSQNIKVRFSQVQRRMTATKAKPDPREGQQMLGVQHHQLQNDSLASESNRGSVFKYDFENDVHQNYGSRGRAVTLKQKVGQ